MPAGGRRQKLLTSFFPLSLSFVVIVVVVVREEEEEEYEYYDKGQGGGRGDVAIVDVRRRSLCPLPR